MRRVSVLLIAVALGLGTFAILVPALGSAQNSTTYSACIAHRPLESAAFSPYYTGGCSGHDEPELDPVSSLPGSARDLTWTAILPSDGAVPVSAVGPTFWWGGTVNDPKSLFGQAFIELQFYPDAVVKKCTPDGGFQVTSAPNLYTACSPVWKVIPTGQAELAAFNAMLTDAATRGPLIMHGGDTITVHWFTTAAADGFHVTVTDLATGHSGTIILDSTTDGPLMPSFDSQTIGDALGWGIVNDTPNSFVWEIGHTSVFSTPAGQYCTPGQTNCDSYDAARWAGFTPLQIVSVTFADGSKAKEWAVVSDFGGISEVNQYCGAAAYGQPYCIYPWFTRGTTSKVTSFRYGVDYPGTTNDFGQATQFAMTTQCGGPFGADSTYCDTIIVP